LGRFIEFTVEAGARTLLFTPGDSLYCVLREREIAELTTFAAEAIGGRALFLAATGLWPTSQAVEFVDFADKAGADLTLVAPAARGMTVEALVGYYRAVSAEHPVMILSGGMSSVGPQVAIRVVERLLREAPGVVGMKEDFTPQFVHQACLLAYDKWAIFAGGAKETHLDMIPYGCDGYMSLFIHHKPKVAHHYWAAIEAGDLSEAAAIAHRYDFSLFNYFNSLAAGGDAGIHAMMELAGICGRWRRAPLPNVTDEEMARFKAFMDEHDML